MLMNMLDRLLLCIRILQKSIRKALCEVVTTTKFYSTLMNGSVEILMMKFSYCSGVTLITVMKKFTPE